MNATPCALITGASRGIGRGIALEVARAGYDVAVNYAGNEAAANETCTMIAELGRKAVPLQADISQAADRERLVASSVKAFGSIDLLVNNAGVAPRARADLMELTEDNYQHLMDVNLRGPFFLTQMVAKQMMLQPRSEAGVRGRIVFITSISAYTASSTRAEYCISKAGLSMTVQLYADRLAPESILVYEIQPGIIATDMTSVVKEKYDSLIRNGLTPQPRWGTPEDIGKAVKAIATGSFDFSTGSVFEVGGGFGIRRL